MYDEINLLFILQIIIWLSINTIFVEILKNIFFFFKKINLLILILNLEIIMKSKKIHKMNQLTSLKASLIMNMKNIFIYWS